MQAVERARALTAPLSEREVLEEARKRPAVPEKPRNRLDPSANFINSVMEEPCDRLPPLHHSYTSGKSLLLIYFELFKWLKPARYRLFTLKSSK